jgi:hypothetical protein
MQAMLRFVEHWFELDRLSMRLTNDFERVTTPIRLLGGGIDEENGPSRILAVVEDQQRRPRSRTARGNIVRCVRLVRATGRYGRSARFGRICEIA